MKNIIDDRHELLSTYQSDCAKCKHFNNETYACPAFPEAIPNKLLTGETNHRTVKSTQEGKLVFTPKFKDK